MAIHLPSTSYFQRGTGFGTGLISNAFEWTAMGWFRIGDIPTGSGFRVFFDFWKDGSNWLFVGTAAGTNQLLVSTSVGGVGLIGNAGTLPVNAWFHLALTYQATSHIFILYLNAINVASITKDFSAVTWNDTELGTFHGLTTWGNLDVSYYREWNGGGDNLTVPQIQAEMASRTAVLGGVHTSTPLISNVQIIDVSGGGNDWTAFGANSNTFGPITPPNVSAITAVVLADGYDVSIDMKDASELWYKYKAKPQDRVFDFWAFGNLPVVFPDLVAFIPTTQVFSSDALVPYLGISNTNDMPIQLPVVNPNTYYFRVVPNAVLVGASPFRVRFNAASALGVNIGDLGILDDTPPFPLAVLNQTTGVPKQFINTFAASAHAEVLLNGKILALDNGSNSLELFDSNLVLLKQIPQVTLGFTVFAIGSNGIDTFYVSDGSAPANVTSIDAFGNIGSTTWTLASGAATSVCANAANTILYYAVSGIIKRWDLVNNVALADHQNVPGGIFCLDSVKVLADDTVLALFAVTGAAPIFIGGYHFSAAPGVLLDTYSFGSIGAAGTNQRLALGTDNLTNFWTYIQLNSPVGIAQINQLQVHPVATLFGANTSIYENGMYQPIRTSVPARFGRSSSGALVVFRATVQPATGGIYQVVPSQWHDTLYQTIVPGNPPTTSTANFRIPNPFALL